MRGLKRLWFFWRKPEPPPPPAPEPPAPVVDPAIAELVDAGTDTVIEVGAKIRIKGRITGNRNRLIVGDAHAASTLTILINGDDNVLELGRGCITKDTYISIGNHVPASGCSVTVGSGTSFEPQCKILAPNHGNIVRIGSNCLISNTITFRAGDSPHLIFDRETGEYLDRTEGLFIGDHVWVGERSYVTKRATVPDGCIVAACAVVTKRFDETNTVLAGNPAKVVKHNVEWVRNRTKIAPGSVHDEALKRFRREVSSRAKDPE
ncbi:acyltransferase [Frigidibacter sp. MR17.14]|uniref:acyltransferase n=1 Tax=Frigidibacter sp. MR17.14 TaxID=3126509 RepID=UPI00301319CE